MAKVSIVITAHNYAKFLPQAIDSALSQTYQNLEVVVVNDGSTDHTDEVLSHYESDPRIVILTLDGVGLAAASNRGISAASGEYIVRLDADDWFDENLVHVLTGYLDAHPTVGMVFCDYYTVDVHGEIIDGVRRFKVNDEVKLLDRPCLAAGAMYRLGCWEAIGGYNENLRYQEDYDFWIKFIEKYSVRNVSLPLMYYRQHGNSMSKAWGPRMEARRWVKKRFVEENRDGFSKEVLAVLPARSDPFGEHKLPLAPLGGKTLLKRAVDLLLGVEAVSRIIVSTDDPDIAEHAQDAGAEVPFLRSRRFNNPVLPFETVVEDLLRRLAEEQDYRPDILVILHPQAPFVTNSHVAEALDTLLLYKTDSVIAVLQDLTYHWKPGPTGLSPVGYQKRVVRQDKDLIFKEAGGLYVVDVPKFMDSLDLLGNTVGHIELTAYESLRIQNPYDYWVAQTMVDAEGQWFRS